MGMPSVSISFTEKAITAVKRGERGIVALILKDENIPETNPITCLSSEDVPNTLSESNQEQIKLAMMGYVNAAKKVIVYVLGADAEDYTEALNALKTVKFDYLVAPSASTDNMTSDIISYVEAQRAQDKLIKAVLPNVVGDNEGIINYATATVRANDKEYTTEQYCSRIAGIIAGTPINISCTYAPLPELTDCARLTKEEMDAAVDAGKLIVWFDGEKVKTARGVNSLTTTTQDKGDSFKKIKIVEAMDMIATDIRTTAEDDYLGKYANTYDNKCLLISAIGNYFDQLKLDGVISAYTIGIDIEANRSYLKGKGTDIESMSDDEIKVADTGSFVFLKATVKILDAIEDIVLPITL